jgi:hypothetical protein
MADICLTLLCTPQVEEKVLDLLLVSPDVKLLTSMPTAVHGLDHKQLDQSEQVLGRARATQIQAIADACAVQSLLDGLRGKLAGAALRYWVTPVAGMGVIV